MKLQLNDAAPSDDSLAVKRKERLEYFLVAMFGAVIGLASL